MAAQGPSLETVLGEAFRVGAQVVLSSRVWSQARRQPEQALPKRKAWFNLELEELESANRSLEPWRKDVGRPLVLEVFLQPWGGELQASPQGQAQAPAETLLEQWVFHYQPQLPHGHALTRSQVSRLNPTSIYKRLIIMLRSLFCYVRVLPAYRMYRDCKRQQGNNFSIGYRVSGTLPRRAAPASPPASGASGSGARSSSSSSCRRSLQQFDFAPVDTPYGQFKVSVAYQPSSRVVLLQQATSPPQLPQLMAEYGAGGGSSAGHAAAAGQLPLRHAMSAQVLPAAATAGPIEPGAVPQAPQRRATVGAVPVSPSGSSGSSGGGSLRRQSSALNPLRNPAWSSMRLSPNLLGGAAYSPHQQQASPFAAAPMPYGSAPQLTHSPQLLRALSLQTVSSSSPRSKPPRPPQRAAAALEGGSPAVPLGARLIPQARHRSASLHSGQQQQFEEECEEEGSEGAAGSSARQSSAPVSIPGCSQGRTRRLRSSGDLWGMHQPADVQKPLSAPAVSHLPSPEAQPESQGTGGIGSHTTDASLPQGPPLLPIVGPESESSGSAASSALFPTSCSPQLPFAFTPSAQSLASYGSKGAMQDSVRLERTSPHMRRTSSGAGASPVAAASTSWPFQGRGLGFSPQQHEYQQQPSAQQAQQAAAGAAQQQQPAGPLAQGRAAGDSPAAAEAEREVQRAQHAQQAIVRHPSWSSQASSQQHKSLGRGGGYSVSPLQDPLLESVLGSSNPRPHSSGVSAGRGLSLASSSGASGGGGGAPPPMLTYPSTAPARGGDLGGGADVSPFGARAVSAPAGGFGSPTVVLHGSGRKLAPSPSAPPAAAAGPVHASAAGVASAGLGASSSDAAVAAFVRLLGEAPPLRFDGGGGGAEDAAGAAWEEGGGGGEASGGGGRLTLETALRQFGLISQRLQSRGIISSVEA